MQLAAGSVSLSTDRFDRPCTRYRSAAGMHQHIFLLPWNRPTGRPAVRSIDLIDVEGGPPAGRDRMHDSTADRAVA
jgi:hypothetical protein